MRRRTLFTVVASCCLPAELRLLLLLSHLLKDAVLLHRLAPTGSTAGLAQPSRLPPSRPFIDADARHWCGRRRFMWLSTISSVPRARPHHPPTSLSRLLPSFATNAPSPVLWPSPAPPPHAAHQPPSPPPPACPPPLRGQPRRGCRRHARRGGRHQRPPTKRSRPSRPPRPPPLPRAWASGALRRCRPRRAPPPLPTVPGGTRGCGADAGGTPGAQRVGGGAGAVASGGGAPPPVAATAAAAAVGVVVAGRPMMAGRRGRRQTRWWSTQRGGGGGPPRRGRGRRGGGATRMSGGATRRGDFRSRGERRGGSGGWWRARPCGWGCCRWGGGHRPLRGCWPTMPPHREAQRRRRRAGQSGRPRRQWGRRR